MEPAITSVKGYLDYFQVKINSDSDELINKAIGMTKYTSLK